MFECRRHFTAEVAAALARRATLQQPMMLPFADDDAFCRARRCSAAADLRRLPGTIRCRFGAAYGCAAAGLASPASESTSTILASLINVRAVPALVI